MTVRAFRGGAANIAVDVTGVIDEKAAMLAAHESQQRWLDESQGLGSYIESMRGLSRSGAWSADSPAKA